ncbi:C40 family peptidase [Microtetraspora sp. NBRC 16547]|uniref:C40 family peptidase n=1 Tax=Microtetraspora sp. NBRC 16547 TaxID=3030993 RepID=UPI0024A46DC5|nr:C40 family peptidase [Microtetraspora sp. NBRC 16547]GLX02138.1 hypothetical protein Misp02_62240 [Microtetraspora sp. NBRC 16547]
MTDMWDTYLHPIQRIIDELSADESGITTLLAHLRKVAGDITTHTGALTRAVNSVNDAWNGEAADAFAAYMARYPKAAADMSGAVKGCAGLLQTAETALSTAKGEVQTIYNEKRAWLDEQRRNTSSSTISMTHIRSQVEKGVAAAAGPKQRAVEAVKNATGEINKRLGDFAFFSSIPAPGDQDFVPGNNPAMRWIPDPAFQHGGTVLAGYDGTGAAPGADSGAGSGAAPASRSGSGAQATGAHGYGSGGVTYRSQDVRVPPNAHSLANNPRAGAVVDYALKQLGDPYVWGATGPNSFDCSGLTLRAYEAAGISIPRVAADQWFRGPRIPDGTEQAGDLIFFDNNGDGSPDHVGIVLDPEKHTMIHAPNSRSVVRIENYANYSTPRVGFTRPGNQ